jgi:hypothetical protein
MIYLQSKFYFGLQVLQLLKVNTKAHDSKWELCHLFLSLRENLIVLTLFLDFAKI